MMGFSLCGKSLLWGHAATFPPGLNKDLLPELSTDGTGCALEISTLTGRKRDPNCFAQRFCCSPQVYSPQERLTGYPGCGLGGHSPCLSQTLHRSQVRQYLQAERKQALIVQIPGQRQ